MISKPSFVMALPFFNPFIRLPSSKISISETSKMISSLLKDLDVNKLQIKNTQRI